MLVWVCVSVLVFIFEVIIFIWLGDIELKVLVSVMVIEYGFLFVDDVEYYMVNGVCLVLVCLCRIGK